MRKHGLLGYIILILSFGEARTMNISVSNQKCEICDKVFKMRKTLQKHIKKVHGNKGNKIWQCEICRKHFSESGPLKLHLN